MPQPTRRIITLTYRAPIEIVEDDWPQIAQYETKEHLLAVRRHSDGRTIVYYADLDDRERRHGFLLEQTADVGALVYKTAELAGIGAEHARLVMSRMPPEQL